MVKGLTPEIFIAPVAFAELTQRAASFQKAFALSPAMETFVTTAGIGSLLKLLVYSDVNGAPTNILIESLSLVASTTGIKTHPVSFTFTAGTTYWLGCFIGTNNVNLYTIPTEQQTPISSNGFTGAYGQLVVASTFPTAPATLGAATPSVSLNLPVINLISA